MAGLIRAFDWAATPLGPIAGWPQSLRTIVDLMLSSSGMMSLVWGAQAIHLYNDAFTELLREHRARALGRSAFDTFARSRSTFADDIAAGMAGQSARMRGHRYSVLRNGRLEDAWFDVDYTPIRNEAGAVTGILWMLNETTARRQAEAALRASEARYRQFAQASASILWIRSADTLHMEFASEATSSVYGVDPDAILGEPRRWAALIVPEDRDAALAHLERARAGESVVHEYRIQCPADRSFRWIRSTDFPLHDGEGRIERVGGIAEDVTESRLAIAHTAVLLAELQHRVRNLMAMIRSVTARTGELAESVPDYAALMAGRLVTLARVQSLLTRGGHAGIGVVGIVRDELGAQAPHEGQYTLDGPQVALSPKTAEVLTLAVHELATNAFKYGALATPHGHVSVRWETFDQDGTVWLGFDWVERVSPGPPPNPAGPRRRGFGSELIEERIPYELGGRGSLALDRGGARCRLEFPLREGGSILETDAPQRVTVPGGGLDMTGEPDLAGLRVLVVEDDYYLASDIARALRGAGAAVLGPDPAEDAARERLRTDRPDAAVIDIGLGASASFVLARMLADQGVPFLFTTGYDAAAIPAEFVPVERLEKPVTLRHVVGAVARLAGRSATACPPASIR